jgi:predicted nucleic acid-binding protein
VKPTFIDTSFLIALVLADDALHERALRWQETITGPLLTTEYVIVEFFDALSSESLRSLAVQTAELLRRDPIVTVVAASTSVLEEGISFFTSRRDKRWGLTDCISFCAMTRAGASDALTADQHFKQAGFTALLRDEQSA